jgi:hypothetical protein
MRELESWKNRADDVTTQIEKEQEKKFELFLEKTIHPHKGHKLYEFNLDTGEVKEAEYDLKSDYIWQPNWKPGMPIASNRALLVKQGCTYVSALNKAAAIKKFNQQRDGSKFKEKGAIKFY